MSVQAFGAGVEPLICSIGVTVGNFLTLSNDVITVHHLLVSCITLSTKNGGGSSSHLGFGLIGFEQPQPAIAGETHVERSH